MMKRILAGLGVVSSLAVAHVAYAAEPPKPEFQAANEVSVEAEVMKVNKKTREITLKAKNGEEATIVAGSEVRNFDQIKKGDRLKVRYIESLMMELKKGGGEPVTVTSAQDVERALPGAKPGGTITESVKARGTVTKLDPKTQTVTVQGPERTISLHVTRKEIFDQIKKGDQIEATYKEAMAVSVESAKR